MVATATATGATAIQQIRVGDRVWARDLTTGTSRVRRVSGLFSDSRSKATTTTTSAAPSCWFTTAPEPVAPVQLEAYVRSGATGFRLSQLPTLPAAATRRRPGPAAR
jgi:hypothetical protein